MRIQIEELLKKYERYRDESQDLLDKFADMEDKKNKILGFIGTYTTIIEDLQNLLDESKEWHNDYVKGINNDISRAQRDYNSTQEYFFKGQLDMLKKIFKERPKINIKF